MADEIGLLIESFQTNITAVWTLVGVSEEMIAEITYNIALLFKVDVETLGSNPVGSIYSDVILVIFPSVVR